MTEAQLLTTPVGFAAIKLGIKLYDWQARALTWFEFAPGGRVKGSLCTPNGAGKDAVVISALSLWWVFAHRRGRVIITSYDYKQIEDQTRPGIHRHQQLFPDWRFLENTVKTDTGGWIRMYATDDPGRVEGGHRETLPDGRPNPEGPLLIILNECKSLPDPIIDAFDRMTFDGLLYASSPGQMRGRFYESQFRPEQGFLRCRVGLKDCPHKTAQQLEDIVKKYGENHPFTRSTIHGEFMEAEGESRFDRDGLLVLRAMAEVGHAIAARGVLNPQMWQHAGAPQQTWSEARDGWVWMQEAPRLGCRYIGFCDPMTGEQSEGSLERDTHAAGIIRAAYTDSRGIGHDAELVAAFYVPSDAESSGAACRWDNDVLAARFAMLLRHYGNCPAVVEANNAGTEVIRLLMLEGCNLWRREKPNHRIPGKQLEVVGFQTTSATKNYWIGAIGSAVREQTINCRFLPAVKQLETFIINARGTGEAQDGAHDDWCFVAGTRILTPSGEVSIETLKAGDLVMTRHGPRPVIRIMSRIKPVIANLGLVGTFDHPIITPQGEFALSILNDEDMLYIWNSSKQSVEKRSFTEAKNTTATPCRIADNCASIFGDMIIGRNLLFRFIGKFGLMLTGKFQSAMLSTIRTATRLITTLGIWRSCVEESTCGYTQWSQGGGVFLPKMQSGLSFSHGPDLQNGRSGSVQINSRNGMEPRQEPHFSVKSGMLCVPAAALLLGLLSSALSIVQKVATLGLRIAGLTQRRRVFNLQVADSPEYFANGILVHNCTGLGLGMLQIATAQELVSNAALPVQQWGGVTMMQNFQPQASGFGACS